MPTRIIRSLRDVPPESHVVTIGNFDGVHRGHQFLIGTAVRRTAATGARSLVITFEPLPLEVLRPAAAPKRLTTLDERLRLIAALGVDTILVLRFDREFAGWSAREFVERVTTAAHPVAFVVGEDFHFGHDRAGTPALLEEMGAGLGFDVDTVQRIGGEEISSTRIRQLLSEGDVAGAAELLGRPYALTGTVERGAGRGHSLGFPTANLAIPENLAVPADGIYAALAAVDHEPPLLQALPYVGPRPTFDGSSRSVEVYLIDFSADLYGQELSVLFVQHLRGDQRFNSVEHLIEQMRRDEAEARRMLAGAADRWPWDQIAALIGSGEGVKSVSE